ncbi:MlaD family protein [Conexibacter sp. DBS9H8]|uniref:MlaD family protein n=1 Tax=Conexibacter sp. DBS9H8 TaxID=2937801 RepID=UPI00200F73FB|nr:MlaD family protein [Conexibacter sp. DBS9H8]
MPFSAKTRRRPDRLFPIVGVLAIAVLVFAVYVSYTSNRGLPWQSTYDVSVAVPNADRLIPTDEVRIGGVRVGQVASVSAEQRTDGQPFARLQLALDPSIRLPLDTRVRVGSASILGATYVELLPGTGARTVPNGGELPLANSQPTVQLTDLLDVFNRSTARALQASLGDLGYGVAGRGPALNSTLGSLDLLLPPLNEVGSALAAPSTRLPAFLHGYETIADALAPVARQLAGVFAGGAVTFAAIARVRSPLGATIEALPPAEQSVTSNFARLQPALDSLATTLADLRPAGPLLPGALRAANAALAAGVPALRLLPGFTSRLDPTLGALRALSLNSATDGSVRELTGLSDALVAPLAALLPAQLQCNIVPLWARDFASGFGDLGFGTGPGMALVGLTHLGATGEMLQNAVPSSNVAINNTPTENFSECEAGNEPYTGHQILTNPPRELSNQTIHTTPPPGVLTLARRAGLLDNPAPGER